jgi:ankyrin repeat protein
MLRGFILALLSILDAHRDSVELGTNTKGIICLEGFQENLSAANTHSFGGQHVASTCVADMDNGTLDLTHRNRPPIPATIFLDGKNAYGRNIVASLASHVANFSMIYTPLDKRSYPSSPASCKRIVGEIKKWVTPSVPAFLGEVEAAPIQSWLSPAKTLFRYDSTRAMEGSGKWLLEHQSFRDWLAPKGNILWLTGKPGSGKSTLAKFLVDSIRENSIRLQSPATVTTLFCDYRYPLQRERGSTKGPLLRALLYQILENKPSILSSLCCRNATFHLPERPEDLDHRYYQVCLRAALSAATNTSTLFFIIDGLDECDPDIQNDLLECIDLIRKVPRSCQKIRVAITSRWLSSLERKYRMERINLDTENSQDIATFCSVMLSSKLAGPEMILDYHPPKVLEKDPHRDGLQGLIDELTKKAEGCFLWVSLVLKSLSDDFSHEKHPRYIMEEWQNAVRKIPAGLNTLYSKLLEGISMEDKFISQLLFVWCSFTVKPLTTSEIRAALRYSDGGFELEPILHDGAQFNWDSQLGKISCGLIEVRHDPLSDLSTVQLLHLSVKEYLTGPGSLHLLAGAACSDAAVGFAHTLIARACISSLEHNVFSLTGTEDSFFTYSVLNWGFHAKSGDKLGVSQEYLIDDFQWPSAERVSLWLEAYHRFKGPRSRAPKRTSLLHVASHYGLLSTAEALLVQLSTKVDWDLNDDIGFTPLHHAVASGHVDVTRKLLEHGAMVNNVNMENRTPLLLALKSGHENVVRLLLENGANVNVMDDRGMTPLQHAVQSEDFDAVRQLISAGADINALLPGGHSILTLAVASGNEAVAESVLSDQKIIEESCWPSTTFGIALAFAAALGFGNLVQTLLISDRFADPDDPSLRQAFIAAIASGSEDIVLLLLDFGCHPDVHDHQYGQAALSIAAGSGFEHIVRLLLQRGADPNNQDIQTGKTPIIHAISRGFPAIVDLLLEHGARMDLPERPCVPAHDGWISRIVLALTHQRPSGNKSGNTGHGSGASSTESVIGTPYERDHESPPSSQSRKRGRHKKVPGDDGNESEDEFRVQKRPRNRIKPDPQFACPFQKRYPDKHDCNPKSNIARLKEHIHRKHVGQFCPDCWNMFNDADAVHAHLRTDSCEKKERVDYSEGICPVQADKLKSRKGVCKMTDEEHWKHVFRIVFPDYHSSIPPSSYYNASENTSERIQQIFYNECLQQRLAQLVGRDRISQVRDLICAFARNPTIITASSNLPEASQILNAPIADQSPTAGLLANNHTNTRRTSSVNQQLIDQYPLLPFEMFPLVPQLEQNSFGSPFAQVPSDSGIVTHVSSMGDQLPSNQNHSMYTLGAQDLNSLNDTASRGPPLPLTFNNPMNSQETWPASEYASMQLHPDSYSAWDAGDKLPGSENQDGVE